MDEDRVSLDDWTVPYTTLLEQLSYHHTGVTGWERPMKYNVISLSLVYDPKQLTRLAGWTLHCGDWYIEGHGELSLRRFLRKFNPDA